MVPPTLFAIFVSDGAGVPVAVFLSLGFVQAIVGNIVIPKAQGDRLNLDPVLVIYSLAVWGFLWGVAGALLAAPFTVALIVISARLSRLRWLSVLLTAR